MLLIWVVREASYIMYGKNARGFLGLAFFYFWEDAEGVVFGLGNRLCCGTPPSLTLPARGREGSGV
jgi:hypothetical protein